MQTGLSVVVASLNGAKTISQALDSLAAQDYAEPWEIVLADNGSTDDTRAIFAACARDNPGIRMRVVDASARRGKSFALNVGIAAAAADRLVFLDDDDMVAPDYLRAMAAALADHDFVAARIDVRRLNPDWSQLGRSHPQSGRLQRLPHAPFCRHAGGATLGMRRAVFERVGGFDLDQGALEDTDFCIRAHLAGVELAFAPDATYHIRFRSDPEAARRQSFAYNRARAQLRRRYVGASGRFAPKRWLDLGAEFAWLGWLACWRAATTMAGRPQPPLRAASFGRRLGAAEGALAGAIRFGVAPAAPGHARIKRAVARKVRGVVAQSLGSWAGSLVAVRTQQKCIALTFDDGPDPASTPRLLDTLARIGAKATFFVIGSRAERHPELMARIVSEGHEIGNHTWDHPSLATLRPGEVADQLGRAKRALAPAGQRLMRPPYGDQVYATNRVARRLGYAVVLWSLSGEDWLGHDAATIAGRICAQAAPGAIVLLHDSLSTFESETCRDRGPTIEAVALAAERLPGWRFVTVSELTAMGAPVYRAVRKTSKPEYLAGLRTAPALAPPSLG